MPATKTPSKQPAPKKTTPSSRSRRAATPKKATATSSNSEPFFTIRFTNQTLYWLILCSLVLALGIWVLTLTMRVDSLYDQIEQNNRESALLEERLIELKRNNAE